MSLQTQSMDMIAWYGCNHKSSGLLASVSSDGMGTAAPFRVVPHVTPPH